MAGCSVKSAAWNVSTPSLQCLPEELLSNIVLRLDCDDACALRLTCTAIAGKTIHDFGHEFFGEKAFLLTPESLKVLVGIAESARLRRFLKKVNILTGRFVEREAQCAYGCSCSWHPTVRQMEAFRAYVAGQKRLAESGDDVRMLSRAFARLPALHTIRLVDNPTLLCAGVDTAGLRKIARKTARPPGFEWPPDLPDGRYAAWFSHVWKTLVQSIVKSGITSLTCFSTRIANPVNGLSISPDLKFSSKTRDGLAKAFAHVTSLGLVVPSTLTAHKANRVQPEVAGEILRSFAALFPRLEELSLRCDFGDNSGAACSRLVQHLPLSNFKTLRLEGILIDAVSLGAALARCVSLEELRLTSVDLSDASWVSILEILQGLPKLWHLDLMYLTDRGCKAYFLKQRAHLTGDELFAGDEDGWDDEDEAYTDDDDDDDNNNMPDRDPWAAEADVTPGDPINAGADAHTTVDFDPPASMPTTTFASHVAIAAATASASATAAPSKVDGKEYDDDEKEKENDFTAPGHHGGPERGYYVCIRTRAGIAKYLPIFKAEYNVGSGMDDLILNGPPGLANMMVAGILGVPNGFALPMAPIVQGSTAPQASQVGPAGAGAAAGSPMSDQNLLNAVQSMAVPPLVNPPVVASGPNLVNTIPLSPTSGSASVLADDNNANININHGSPLSAHPHPLAISSSTNPTLSPPISTGILMAAQFGDHIFDGTHYRNATTDSSHVRPSPPPPSPLPPRASSSSFSYFGPSAAVVGGERGNAYPDARMMENEDVEGEGASMVLGDHH